VAILFRRRTIVPDPAEFTVTADPHIQRLHDAISDPVRRDTFVQLVLTDFAAAPGEPAYEKIRLRLAPVGESWQGDFFTANKHVTKNLDADEALRLLELPFRRAHLQTTAGDLHVRITKKGRVLLSEGRPSVTQRPAEVEHDRTKQYLLPADRPSALLLALGIQTHTGQIRTGRRGKFHQINQFLEILDSLPDVRALDTRRVARQGRAARRGLHIVDCGCGAAYLTFAAHYYLREICGLDPLTIGVDANVELIGKCNELRDRLGYEHLRFEQARIADFSPPAAPHIVLSLHACDTATDEAIALGVRWHSRAILAAPCCQHELRDQLENEAMRAVLRHGVLKGRQADIVTDAARAAILRIRGYRCEVIEFVSPEHTGKNLMLRAERRSTRPLPGAEADYAALKAAWHITPALERLVENMECGLS
jgi:hypothetical protein